VRSREGGRAVDVRLRVDRGREDRCSAQDLRALGHAAVPDAYGDIFGFFKPGQIRDVISGEISGIEITQAFLFAVSVYIAIASVMVFLTLVLRPAVCRWVNLVLAILYIASIVAAAIGESAYYVFLSAVEIAVLVLIVRYAWTWPRRQEIGSARST
jgi:hypothetical protein